MITTNKCKGSGDRDPVARWKPMSAWYAVVATLNSSSEVMNAACRSLRLVIHREPVNDG